MAATLPVSPFAASPFSDGGTPGKEMRRSAWFTRAPHRKNSPESKGEATPELQLTYFAGKTTITFNKVKIGKAKTCKLRLRNPTDVELELFLEKFPVKKGFTASEQRWTIPPEDDTIMTITWVPTKEGNIRELATFKFDGAHRLQIIILGTAVASPKKTKKRRKWNVKSGTSGIADLRKRCLQNSSNQNRATMTLGKKQPSPVISRHDAENIAPSEVPLPIIQPPDEEDTDVATEMADIPKTPSSMRRSRTFELLNATLDTTPVIGGDTPSPLKPATAVSPLQESQAFNVSMSPTGVPQFTDEMYALYGISPDVKGFVGKGIQSRLTFCVDKSQPLPTRLSSSPKDDLKVQPHSLEIQPVKLPEMKNLSAELVEEIDVNSPIEKDEALPFLISDTPASHTALIGSFLLPSDTDETPSRRQSSTPLTSTEKTNQAQLEKRASLVSLPVHKDEDTDPKQAEPEKLWDGLFKAPQAVPPRRRTIQVSGGAQSKPMSQAEKRLKAFQRAERRKSGVGAGRVRRHSIGSPKVTRPKNVPVCEVVEAVLDVQPRRLSAASVNRTGAPQMESRRQSLASQTVTKSKPVALSDVAEESDVKPRRLTSGVVVKTDAPSIARRQSLASRTVTKKKDVSSVGVAEQAEVDPRRLSSATVTKTEAPHLANRRQSLASQTVTKTKTSAVLPKDVTDQIGQADEEPRRLSTATVTKAEPSLYLLPENRLSEEGAGVCKKLFTESTSSTASSGQQETDAAVLPHQDSSLLMSMSEVDVTDHNISIASIASQDLFPVHESVVTSKIKRSAQGRKPLSNANKRARVEPEAGNGRKTYRPIRKPSTSSLRERKSSTSSAKGVPMAKLKLRKPQRKAIASHPNLYAAQNMFYDERWMEKQERGFTKWLNYVLTPDEAECPQDPKCQGTKIDAGTICIENHEDITLAPTREELSLKSYTARRRLNKLRRAACRLFESEPIVIVVQRLEQEIESFRLRVRPDKHINRDYGARQQLLNLFLSFNPLWLRIGLETTYGVTLNLKSNTDVLGLSKFIVSRLLNNPDIAREYAHPTVPHLYRDGYEEVLARFTLKKFLLLVFFLDRSKQTKLIDHDPCLFCKDAEIKSSRDLLLHFSRDYLSGEGDVTRHLSYFGYTVSHVQTPLHEFDFAVANLKVDLRCGLRLTRIMELLTHKWTLTTQLRMPAISRLQKLHNVEVALAAMKEIGIDVESGGLNHKVIVDGHREKTLELLWRLIFHFQINVRLNGDKLKEEISFLKKNLVLQKKLAAVSLPCPLKAGSDDERRCSDPGLYFKSARLSLLLEWCRAVCAYYDLKIENFTVSFSDGRGLCYLIHHYHPSLLPFDDIRQDTTQSQQQKEEESDGDSDQSLDSVWTKTYSPSTGKPTDYDVLLSNEKYNYKVLYDAVGQLGGVPFMVKSADMSNTIPNEKVLITYLSYLCERMLDLREETRAARVIQAAWRKHKLRREIQKHQERIEAATKIQIKVREFLKRRHEERMQDAIVKAQALWRGKLARREAGKLRQKQLEVRQEQCAVVIQAHVRGYLAKRYVMNQKKSVVKIQAVVRGHLVRKHLYRVQAAVFTIENFYYAYKLGQDTREVYRTLKEATIKIQSVFRGLMARREVRREVAARLLQAHWRGTCQRQRFLALKGAVVKMQALVKAKQAKIVFDKTRAAAVVIQQHYRAAMIGQQVQQQYHLQRHACITIQAHYRGHCARMIAKKHRAAKTIQTNFRMYVAKRDFLKMKAATVVLQTSFRRYQAQKKYLRLRGAAVTIQQKVKATLVARHQRRDYLTLKATAVLAQSLYRARLTRKLVERIRAAIAIQAAFRGFRAHKEYKQVKNAVITLQTSVRRMQAMKCYKATKEAAVLIQRYYRAHLLRNDAVRRYQCMRSSAIKVQSTFRMYKTREEYTKSRRVIIRLQAAVKAKLAQKRYQEMRVAAKKIQMRFRETLAAQQCRQGFLRLKGTVILAQSLHRGRQARKLFKRIKAAVKVQAVYRGYLAFKEYHLMKKSAVVIQKNARSLQAVKKYQETRSAVITIQRCYKAHVMRDIAMQRYKEMKVAAVMIQSGFRGHRERKRFTQQKNAAIKIQALFRKNQAQQRYLRLRKATLVLQIRFRAHLIQQKTQKDYQEFRNALITIQSFYRGHVARQLAKQHRAARLIQSIYRMHVARTAYLKLRNATVKIQAAIKCHQARTQYLKMKKAAVVIQDRYRANVLCKNQLRDYQKLKGTVILAQTLYRGRLARKRVQKMRAAIKIQAAFKGYRQMKKYLRARDAAIKIQAAVRCHQARTKYLKMKEAAVIIQRRYRATVLCKNQHKNFLKLKGTVILAQSLYRGRLARKRVEKIRAAVKIQAAFRGYRQKKTYLRTRDAAVKIQSSWRRYKARLNFQNLKKSAVVIQGYFRAHLLRNKCQQEFQSTKKAVITLQSVYRGYVARQLAKKHRAARLIQSIYRMHVARREYLKLRVAAVKIQAVVRCHQARTSYLKMKEAVVNIQRWYRATVLCKNQQKDFLKLKGTVILAQSLYRGRLARKRVEKIRAAVKIQAVFRGYIQKKKYLRTRDAAIKIQTVFRRNRAVENYRRVKESTEIIQSYFRAHQLRKYHQREYQAMKTASIKIQAFYRRHQARVAYLATRAAVVKIQASVKGKLAQRRYQMLKLATISIQRQYRAQQLYKKEHRAYQEIKKACVTVQAVYRGYQGRKLSQKHRAARKIQATYRMCREKQNYQNLRSSTILLQSVVRRHQQRKQYLEIKKSAVVIQKKLQATIKARQQRRAFLRLKGMTILAQSLFRGHLARRHVARIRAAQKIQSVYRGYVARCKYHKLKKSAVIIQSNVRRCQAVHQFRRLKNATVVIQTRYRACVLRDQDVAKYQMTKKSVITAQAVWRGYKERKAYQSLRRATVKMQAIVRALQAQKQYQELKHAVCTIQNRWRDTLAAKKQRREFLKLKGTVILAQSLQRGRVARKHVAKIRAAIRIQTTYRRYNASKKYQQQRQAAILIQSCTRMWQERRRYQNLKKSTIVVQERYRAQLMKRREVFKYQSMKKAAVTIQAYYRGYKDKKVYKELRGATIHLQAHVRKIQAQKRYHELKSAAVVLQRRYHAHMLYQKDRQHYIELKQAAVIIQSYFRGCQARRQVKIEKAAILVTSVMKMYVARKVFMKQKTAAVQIQAFVRGYQTRQQFLKVKSAAVTIQQRARAMFAARKGREDFLELKNAAVVLQSVYRGQLARQRVKEIRAAITIQKVYRGHVALKKYQKTKQAAILIQASVRKYLACRRERREQLLRFAAAVYHHLSATRIQRFYRKVKALQLAKQRLQSVITIQRWMRAKLEFLHFKKMRHGITLLQRAVRHRQEKRHHAATKIQALVRSYLAAAEAEKKKKAIVTFQSVWRGRSLRKSFKSKKLRMIRSRLEEANKNATEEKKLCNRTTTALDYLLDCKTMSNLLTALEDLEITTKLSPACCKRIVANNAVHVIYNLIKGCNRSLPHMQAIGFCISILLNLAKYEETVDAVYEVPGSISIIVDLMSIYRDKGCLIFPKSCTLMVAFSQSRRRAEEIVHTPKIADKLQSIHALCARKRKMNIQRAAIKNKSLNVSSFSASLLSSSSIMATPSKRGPGIRPDWVLRQDKMTDLDEPLHAIETVLKVLKLKRK